ncbi:MAG: prepilin-type N-terminal cleavage/methylation domain-containing protein [Candidatus Dormibacteraeota bacterium]|nr:prepilin-type N-terminal cleavage/methylation domain-containing protein [Candidatus Dormibacteraeota bacterium]
MTTAKAASRRRQAGYTLIELIIASAIGLMVMGALTSVVLTSMVAANTATAHVEAGAQIRNFQFTAYDDFALARTPDTSGSCTPANPCSRDLVLIGSRVSNTGAVEPGYTVRYAFDGGRQLVTRYAETSSRVAASSVTAYSWYIDQAGDAKASVVVNMTVTIAFYNVNYSESQTLRFYPRVTAPASSP